MPPVANVAGRRSIVWTAGLPGANVLAQVDLLKWMPMENETVDGYACPIDPMDALACESCQ